MKLTIESLEIKDDQYEAIAKIKGLTKDPYGGHDGARWIQNEVTKIVVDNLVEQFLRENTHKIMADIDKQQILNMIVLNSAKKISGQ